MTFLQPLLLLALLILPLIVLLHMLNERRRRLAVPSLLHWANLQRKAAGRRIKRLPLTLLLFLHLLIAAALALALGRPQLPSPLGGTRHVALVVDVSTSMAAAEGASTRFELALERAREIIASLDADDRLTLIAAGPQPRVVASGLGQQQAALLKELDGLLPGGSGVDLHGALTLSAAALQPAGERQIVVLTDGALAADALPVLPAPVEWEQLGRPRDNRAIIAFASRPWASNLQVYARVANYSDEQAAVSVQLYGDDEPLGTRTLLLQPDGESELTWTLAARYASLRAELTGDDPLPEDDQAYLNVVQSRPLRALLVSTTPDVLQRALAALPGVSVSVVAPFAYADPGAAEAPDLTVLDGFLPPSWPSGAVLAVNPPAGSPLLDVRAAGRSQRAGALVQSSPLLADINLGSVNFGTLRRVRPPAWARVELALGETPLVLRGRSEGHEIAIWAFDLHSGNLPSRLAFPLLVGRTVRDLAPGQPPQSIAAGTALTLRPDLRTTELRVTAPDGTSTTLPSGPALTVERFAQPGLYQIEELRAGAPHYAGLLGVNAGSAGESDLRTQIAPGFETSSAAGDGQDERRMVDLWPLLAVIALAALLLEWGYIHR